MRKSKKNILFKLLISAAAISLAVYLNRDNFKFPGWNNIEPTVKTAGMNQMNLYKDPENKITEMKDSTEKTDPVKLHFDALVADTHNDFLWQVYDKGADLNKRNSFTQSDIYKFREGGLDIQVFAVWIPMKKVKTSYDFTISQIDRLREFQTLSNGQFEIAGNYDDIIRITGEKKLCGLIGIEGGTAVENDAENVKRFFDMGVRYIGLTWNNSNLIATSAKDAVLNGKKGGLTEFGKEVVKKMNGTGMLIDVSHLSEAAFWDVIEISTQPIIASHSNCYSIDPHYRNLTDEQIKAIAKGNGYIGINFYDEFLAPDGKKNGADIEKIIEHIDHIKETAGIDFIGIGSDFDGGISPPRDLRDATQYPELTKRLFEKGYSPDEIRKILGLNFLRVFKQVCG
ncbi:MAG: dipeptidase [Bacteroidetes bacterium]|nr:dipeptidase [Bacteroidota bacterium]